MRIICEFICLIVSFPDTMVRHNRSYTLNDILYAYDEDAMRFNAKFIILSVLCFGLSYKV